MNDILKWIAIAAGSIGVVYGIIAIFGTGDNQHLKQSAGRVTDNLSRTENIAGDLKTGIDLLTTEAIGSRETATAVAAELRSAQLEAQHAADQAPLAAAAVETTTDKLTKLAHIIKRIDNLNTRAQELVQRLQETRRAAHTQTPAE